MDEAEPFVEVVSPKRFMLSKRDIGSSFADEEPATPPASGDTHAPPEDLSASSSSAGVAPTGGQSQGRLLNVPLDGACAPAPS